MIINSFVFVIFIFVIVFRAVLLCAYARAPPPHLALQPTVGLCFAAL